MADMRQYAGGGPEQLLHREAEIGARDMAGAYAARQFNEAARHEAASRVADHMLGQAQGTAQMLRAPGKMFPRSDIIAIIKAELVMASGEEAIDRLTRLCRVFEGLE
jgi:hypothetical protein